MNTTTKSSQFACGLHLLRYLNLYVMNVGFKESDVDHEVAVVHARRDVQSLETF